MSPSTSRGDPSVARTSHLLCAQATVLSRLGSLIYSVQCLNVVRHVHLDHIIACEFDLMLKHHTLPDVLLEQSLPLQPLTVNPEIIDEPQLQTDAGTDAATQSPAQDCLPHSETDSPETTSVPMRRSNRDRFKPKRLIAEKVISIILDRYHKGNELYILFILIPNFLRHCTL